MVANRKHPVAPAPPRTPSLQPGTKRQTRTSKVTSARRDDQKSNGHRPTSSGSSLLSTRAERKRKSKTFVDFLILFLLSGFTCYSFYVCRPNPLFSSPTYGSQPSLCRALSTYRTHVLEPYVLPPIKQTLHFAQQISEPYVEEAQIRLYPFFKPAKTVVDTFTPHAKSLIWKTKSFWKNAVIPIYTQSLRPYYDTAVVPRYIRYVKPLLVPFQNKAQKLFAYYISNPVRSKINFLLHILHQFYTLHVDPYVRIARPYAYRFSDMTRAVGVNLSSVYSSYVDPTIRTAWKHFFEVFFRFTDGIYTHVKWITGEVDAYRRQYVDRHVYRILEQVADPKVNGNVREADNGSFSIAETRIPSGAQGLPDMSAQETANLENEPLSSPTAPVSISAVFVESSASMEATNNPGTGIPAPTPLKSEIEVAMSVAENADNTSTLKDEPRKEFDTLIVSDFTTPTPANTPSASDEISVEPAITTEPSTPNSDPDLDEFLRELGVEEENTVPTPDDTNETSDEVVASVLPKSEEERLAEVAAKRADIVARHEKWFEKLHTGVQETGDELVRTLQSLRDVSAEDIRRLGSRPSKANKDSVEDTRSLIWVEQDGEKLIKGLEVYLRKAEARCNEWKIPSDSPDDEAKKLKHGTASQEKETFFGIVSKVENKFSARVDRVRFEVHKWYVDLKEREAVEVLRASKEIKELASQAQEDLGMDYAWLDDVSYLDWQRYHDLTRVHDNFDITVRQIANGTSTDPSPPSDPVLEALDVLDRDLQDIILGFNYALSGLRSHGLKVFNSRSLNEGDDDDNDDGFFVVKDNEKRVVDLRGVDLGPVDLKKEAVGVLPIKQDGNEVKDGEGSVEILPVPDAQLPVNSGSGFDASKIIIGKDKVQVEEALRDIPLEPPTQRHAEL